MSLAPKTRLGTYELLGPLGSGGMEEVYRADDLRLGRGAEANEVFTTTHSGPDS